MIEQTTSAVKKVKKKKKKNINEHVIWTDIRINTTHTYAANDDKHLGKVNTKTGFTASKKGLGFLSVTKHFLKNNTQKKKKNYILLYKQQHTWLPCSAFNSAVATHITKQNKKPWWLCFRFYGVVWWVLGRFYHPFKLQNHSYGAKLWLNSFFASLLISSLGFFLSANRWYKKKFNKCPCWKEKNLVNIFPSLLTEEEEKKKLRFRCMHTKINGSIVLFCFVFLTHKQYFVLKRFLCM